MKKVFNSVGLSYEAMLFDARLYIIKAILAIGTGYLLGMHFPITRVDMISVLLGVMYNLEPINVLGIKGGISQLLASTLGAACTGTLIMLFGINVFTIAFSMALTLYVALKLNWRMVSPVAIFTCIYMTQYVQKDVLGNPSIWLTFRLRIAALGLGILIAIIFNYIFSFFYYNKIANKRLEFAKNQLLLGLEYTLKELKNPREERNRMYITLFPSIFNDLDLIHTNIELMAKEAKYFFRNLEPEKLNAVRRILQNFRDINHLTYDINYTIWREGSNLKLEDNVVLSLEEIISTLKDLNFTSNEPYEHKFETNNLLNKDFNGNRITSNINSIVKYVETILSEERELLMYR